MRLLFKLFIFLLLITMVGLAVAFYMIESITEKQLTKVLRVPVSVEDINFSTSGVEVRGLVISNIEGSKLQPAFGVSKVAVTMNPMNFFNHLVEIEKIEVKSPEMAVEVYDLTGNDTNWSRMTAHLRENNQADRADEGAIEGAEAGVSKEYVIRELRITNLQVRATGKVFNNQVLEPAPIKEIVLTDVGQGGGLELDELAAIISRAIRKEASGVIENVLKNVKKGVEGTIKTPGKLLKGVVPGQKPTSGGEEEGENIFESIFGN